MSNHNDVFARCKDISIYDVIEPYTKLKKLGKDYEGPCPVCGGKDRFSITIKKNSCHCRKECGISGDVITAWAKIRGLSNNYEAALELLGESKPPKEWTPTIVKHVEQPQEYLFKTDEWQRKANGLIKRSRENIPDSLIESGSKYLAGRGLTDPAIAEMFTLGIANVWNPAESKEMPAIIMPWFCYGQLSHIKYRFIDSERLRFSSLGGGYPLLFGSNVECDHSTRMSLSEGEINAMSIKAASPEDHSWSVGAEGNEVGIDAAVYRCVELGIEEVVVFFDKYEYAKRAKDKFMESGIRCAAVCSQFGDANEILVSYGPSWLKDLIDKAFKRIDIGCDRCSDLKTIPYRGSKIFQLCPDCGEKA